MNGRRRSGAWFQERPLSAPPSRCVQGDLSGRFPSARRKAGQSKRQKETSIWCITYISTPSFSVKLADMNEREILVVKTGRPGINGLCARHAKLDPDADNVVSYV